MTPFTLDQQAALLAAADTFNTAYLRWFAAAEDREAQGDLLGAREANGMAFGLRRGFSTLIDLALAGLPAELLAEMQRQPTNIYGGTLAANLRQGSKPARIVLDLLGEFLARRGQSVDMPLALAALSTREQLANDQPGVDQSLDVSGEDAGRHVIRPPVIPVCPCLQNDPPNGCHVQMHS
jgi:hypothetical protein